MADHSSSKLANFVIRHRLFFSLFPLLVTGFFLYTLKDLTIQTSVQDFIPQKHPFVEVNNQLMKIFGGLNQVSIAIEPKEGDIFQKNWKEIVGILDLEEQRQLSRLLKKFSHGLFAMASFPPIKGTEHKAL